MNSKCQQTLIESEKIIFLLGCNHRYCIKIGCTPETLRIWHQKYLDKQNPVKVQQLSDQERSKQLERKIKNCNVLTKFYVKQPLFRPGGARPPTQIMVDFIHNNKDLSGVEAICKILPIVASTYYRTLDLVDEKHRFAREHRAKRDLHDEHHAEQIKRIWKESSVRYGVRKVWQN